MAADTLGARSARLFVVDYGLRSVRSLDADGTAGEELLLEGTIAGASLREPANPTQQGDGPAVMWWPLSEGSERIGLLELVFDDAREHPERQATSRTSGG